MHCQSKELVFYTFSVANKAFNKDTWVNDKRHMWKEWRYGHSSLAVDGDVDDSLHNCAILDNYYEEFPVWMVDLGSDQVINGIVITTWQGKGQGERLTQFWANLCPLKSEMVSELEQPT